MRMVRMVMCVGVLVMPLVTKNGFKIAHLVHSLGVVLRVIRRVIRDREEISSFVSRRVTTRHCCSRHPMLVVLTGLYSTVFEPKTVRYRVRRYRLENGLLEVAEVGLGVIFVVPKQKIKVVTNLVVTH